MPSHDVGEQRGKLFRRKIGTLLRNKGVLVADLIIEAAECMIEDILDRRASSPTVVYTRSDSDSNESSTSIFKQNEREVAEMSRGAEDNHNLHSIV